MELNNRKQPINELKLTPKDLVVLIAKVEDGIVSNLAGKEVLTAMLDENKSKHREGMKAFFNAIKGTRDSMRRELQKEKLDMAKINQINDEMKKLEAQMSDRRLEGILEVRKILSPEQFKKFTEKMGDGPEHFKGKRSWGKEEDKK